jgi:transposase
MRYLGIDVSKAKLDCMLFDPASGKRRSKSVLNSSQGLAQLLSYLAHWKIPAQQVHVAMEPTASYHELAATALHDAGCKVSLVNPLRVRRYAQAIGSLNKTDDLDAYLLARYAAQQQPPLWAPPPLAARVLKALLARRDALAGDLQRELNRQEKLPNTDQPAAVQKSLTQTISFLQKQLADLQSEIEQHIDKDPDLRNKHQLLLSIPGVGPAVAQHMSALMSSHNFESAEQLSAYLGLVPLEWQSGTSVKGKTMLSKAGPAHLRKLLYLPAVTAKRCNPHVRALYERLLARGKPKMSAIAAAMRKLAQLCFGVLRSGIPYKAEFAAKPT